MKPQIFKPCKPPKICFYYYLLIIDGDHTAIVSSGFDILFFSGITHFSKVLFDCFLLNLLDQLEYAKFKQSAQTLFIESIVEAANFEFHNTEYEPGKSAGNLSRELMKQIDTRDSNAKYYIDFLSNFIYNIINFSGFKCSNKENMFKKFYRFSVGDESLMQWVKFLELFHVGNNSEGLVKEILHQYILDKFFQLTLKYRNYVLCPKIEESLDDDISPLETAEEQTIRYVAGYILYSVRNSVQNKRSNNGKASSTTLKNGSRKSTVAV